MIEAVMVRDQDGGLTGFKLTGHADSGPYGYDLVCAAVSAVTFGAVNSVEALTGITPEVETAEDGGYLAASLPGDSPVHALEKAQLLFEGMLVSLKTIEDSYPEHIIISDKGGGTHA